MNLAEFYHFPLLPLELRNDIWQNTIIPRVLVIKYDVARGFFSVTPLPTAFSVSKESRASAFDNYHLSFGSVMWLPPQTYVNFSIDTVYLPEELHKQIAMFFSLLTTEEVSRFRYLAIDDDLAVLDASATDYVGDLIPMLEAAVARFPSLIQLISVQSVERFLDADGDWYHREDSDEIEGLEWHWEKVHSHITPTMHLFFEFPRQLLDETVKVRDHMGDMPDANMWRYMRRWTEVSHLVVPALAWQSNAELVSDVDGFFPIKAFNS